MKIVLLRSPGFLSPILRRIFGIKKEKKRSMKVKILTDTASDLTAEEAEKLQVTEIVLPVIFSGESEEVTDKKIF